MNEGAALKLVKPDEKFSGWDAAAGLANDEKEELNAFDNAGAVLLALLAEENNKLLEPAAAAVLPKLNILPVPVDAAGLIDAPKVIDPGCGDPSEPNELKLDGAVPVLLLLLPKLNPFGC